MSLLTLFVAGVVIDPACPLRRAWPEKNSGRAGPIIATLVFLSYCCRSRRRWRDVVDVISAFLASLKRIKRWGFLAAMFGRCLMLLLLLFWRRWSFGRYCHLLLQLWAGCCSKWLGMRLA